ncbi:MAG: DUF1614 domain-containing protein [Acidilobus sp.]|nr:DUF1614 domain-containing protein [Acidilobus sp.]
MGRGSLRSHGRLIISYPTHPAFLWGYLIIGALLVFLFLGFPGLVASVSSSRLAWPLWALATLLIALSPPLSFLNIAIARVSTGTLVTELDVDYVEFFGIPIPVPRIRTREVKTILAVNVGGALVPIISSGIFAYLLLNSPYSWRFGVAALLDVGLTSAVVYLLSRPVAGVGIVVPAFVAPLMAALVAVASVGFGVAAATAAYIGGSVGSLIGADIIRLSKSFRELRAPMLSIGGAGVFDGVFISGVMAFVLAL